MKRYDYLIVGAGPAGLFACYELLKKGKKNILLIDLGKRIEDRKAKDVMVGIGGAGTYSDGKLTLTANLSHEKAFHLISKFQYQKILDYVDSIFNKFEVDPELIPGITLSKISKPSIMFNTILWGNPIDISPGTTFKRVGSTKDFSNLDHVLLLPSLKS